MRKLAWVVMVTAVAIGAAWSCGGGSSGSSPQVGALTRTIIEKKTVDVGGGMAATVTLSRGGSVVTVDFPAGALPMRTPVEVQLEVVKRGASATPVDDQAVAITSPGISFTQPARMRQTVSPPPPGKTYVAVQLGSDGQTWVQRGAARAVDAPATDGKQTWEMDLPGTGLFAIAYVAPPLPASCKSLPPCLASVLRDCPFFGSCTSAFDLSTGAAQICFDSGTRLTSTGDTVTVLRPDGRVCMTAETAVTADAGATDDVKEVYRDGEGKLLFTYEVKVNASGTDGEETITCAGGAPQKWVPPVDCALLQQNASCTPGTCGGVSSTDFTPDGGLVTDPSGAVLVASTGTLSFPVTPVGTSSPPASITISNVGSVASSTVTRMLVGEATADFQVTTDCGPPLAPGGTCTATVTFVPTVEGARTAVLQVFSAGATNAASVYLAGDTMERAALAFTPVTQSFGTVAVGQTSQTVAFVLSNGGAPTTVAPTVNLSASDVTSFAIVSNSCTDPLATGASCIVGVVFQPKSAGDKVGLLAATLPSGGGATASLSGTGQ